MQPTPGEVLRHPPAAALPTAWMPRVGRTLAFCLSHSSGRGRGNPKVVGCGELEVLHNVLRQEAEEHVIVSLHGRIRCVKVDVNC